MLPGDHQEGFIIKWSYENIHMEFLPFNSFVCGINTKTQKGKNYSSFTISA